MATRMVWSRSTSDVVRPLRSLRHVPLLHLVLKKQGTRVPFGHCHNRKCMISCCQNLQICFKSPLVVLFFSDTVQGHLTQRPMFNPSNLSQSSFDGRRPARQLPTSHRLCAQSTTRVAECDRQAADLHDGPRAGSLQWDTECILAPHVFPLE